MDFESCDFGLSVIFKSLLQAVDFFRRLAITVDEKFIFFLKLLRSFFLCFFCGFFRGGFWLLFRLRFGRFLPLGFRFFAIAQVQLLREFFDFFLCLRKFFLGFVYFFLCAFVG